MEGFNSKSNIFVICATNLPQNLDRAFLRRCNYKFYAGLPDIQDRYELFDMYLKSEKKRSPAISEADLNYLAKNSEYYSPADIKTLCSQALLRTIDETMQATHWAKFNYDGELKYIPIAAGHPHAFEASYTDLDASKVQRSFINLVIYFFYKYACIIFLVSV